MKNLIKNFWILFYVLALSLPIDVVAQLELVPVLPDRTDAVDTRTFGEDCATVNIQLPIDVINRDCLEQYENENVVISYQLRNCHGAIENWWCSFHHVEFLVNGVTIMTNDLEEIDWVGSSNTTSIQTLPLSLLNSVIGNNDIEEMCFEVKVYEKCIGRSPSLIASHSSCVPVVSEGDTYYLVKYSDEVIPEYLGCIKDNPDLQICCNEDVAKTLTYTVVASYSTSSNTSISIGLPNLEYSTGSVTLSDPIDYTSSNSEIEIHEQAISRTDEIIVESIDGQCTSIEPILFFRKKYFYQYEAVCEGEDLLVGVNELESKLLWRVGFRLCEAFSCPDERPEIVLTKQIASVRSHENCYANISATIPEVYDGELEFTWTGPNDFSSNEQNLENVPFGEYLLTVSDDCCNEYEYSYFLCDDIVKGQWMFQNENFTYCRSLRCMSDDCNVEIGEECVVPDDIQITVENGNCVERHYYENELIGELSTAMEVRYEYDDFLVKCKKIVYCNDEIFNEETENPTFGDWTYNEFVDNCTRSILCFDQPGLVNDETVIAQIDEFYNEVFGQCELHITCDNEEVLNEVTFADYSNWRINDFNDFCEADVECNGSEIFGVVHSELPSNTYEWKHDLSNSFGEECYRDVICNGELVVQYAPAIITSKICYCDPLDVEGGEIPYEVIICPDDTVFEEECPPYDDCLGTFQEDHGIEVRELSLDIGVYPNPANDLLFINGVQYNSTYSYKIFSIDGRVLLNKNITSPSIDISSLKAGVLYIEIYNNVNKNIFNQKIIRI